MKMRIILEKNSDEIIGETFYMIPKIDYSNRHLLRGAKLWLWSCFTSHLSKIK